MPLNRKPAASEVSTDAPSRVPKDHNQRREAFRRFMSARGLTSNLWPQS
jgi:hypothetical protein